MKKIAALLLFCAVFIIAATAAAQEIRIGLMSRIYNAAQVTVGSSTIAVGFEVDGIYTERAVFHGAGSHSHQATVFLCV